MWTRVRSDGWAAIPTRKSSSKGTAPKGKPRLRLNPKDTERNRRTCSRSLPSLLRASSMDRVVLWKCTNCHCSNSKGEGEKRTPFGPGEIVVLRQSIDL